MPKCDLTGKKRLIGNNVSHANNRTKMVQRPNVQKKRIWVPEENRWVTLHLSTRAVRSIDRVGLYAYARKHGLDVKELVG
jgi:large subunit ribosomal protein L28